MRRVLGPQRWHPVGAQEVGEEQGRDHNRTWTHPWPVEGSGRSLCWDSIPQPGFSGFMAYWCCLSTDFCHIQPKGPLECVMLPASESSGESVGLGVQAMARHQQRIRKGSPLSFLQIGGKSLPPGTKQVVVALGGTQGTEEPRDSRQSHPNKAAFWLKLPEGLRFKEPTLCCPASPQSSGPFTCTGLSVGPRQVSRAPAVRCGWTSRAQFLFQAKRLPKAPSCRPFPAVAGSH